MSKDPVITRIENQLAIIAGTFIQARNFAERNGLARDCWRSIQRVEDIYGFRTVNYCKIGTYFERRNFHQLENMLLANGAVEVEVFKSSLDKWKVNNGTR